MRNNRIFGKSDGRGSARQWAALAAFAACAAMLPAVSASAADSALEQERADWFAVAQAPAAGSSQPGTAVPATQPQSQPPAGRDYFEPPPMPEFMLRKPERPLSVEEMQRQADEAAQKARRSRGTASGSPPPVFMQPDASAPVNRE